MAFVAGAEEARTHEADAGHQAAGDESATSILHDVGNVLNSVNVSLVTVAEIISRSRLPLLEEAAALLSAQLKDVSTFLTQDPKGKQIPSLVIAISANLKDEREKLASEIGLLSKNIEHIKAIISLQQSHAKAARPPEEVHIEDLLRDVLAVNAADLEESRVRIVIKHEDVPCITVEKHEVLRILVNLVSNANHAMAVTTGRERVLTLATRVARGSMVEITVRDNGIGVPKDNLRRIFERGFTTRADGHGFGLHGSAIAATRMHGSLTVTSEGEDCGAVFTLRLPLEARGVSSADGSR
jgi:two-component system, NtrC family, sensor kinase